MADDFQAVLLIVDDSGLERLVLRRTLEKGGYGIVEAKDGNEALAVFERETPDLVLMDVMMAGMDGIAACSALRRLPGGETVPVLMVTSLDDSESVDLAFQAGATDFVTKPIHWPVLRQRVKRLLEARRMERALRESEDRYRQIVETSLEGIFVVDEEARFIFVNQRLTHMLGVSEDKILGKPMGHYLKVAPSEEENFDGGGPPDSRDVRFLGKDGAERWGLLSTGMILSKTPDQPDLILGMIADVTGRRTAEQEMLRKLNTAIEQAADCVVITGATGLIQYVNPAFESVTGYTRNEAVGRHFQSLQGGPTDLAAYRELSEALVGGKYWQGTYLTKRKDGTSYREEAVISPVKDPSGKILNFVAVRRDVTEKERLESIAEAVNMMDNVGYIFSGIRHELGNPINSIKTTLAVLKKNLPQLSPEATLNYIDRSLAEIGRVEYLLKTLKSFSMHENPKMQAIETVTYLERFLSLVEEDFAKRGIRIKRDFGMEVGSMLADSRALHQVLLNLLSNAAEAMDEREDPEIRISVLRRGNRVEIKVADNGVGITESRQADLFKPFYTSKPQGTGLGLVIVKKMMVKMNGTIEIFSRYDFGTEVVLTLGVA